MIIHFCVLIITMVLAVFLPQVVAHNCIHDTLPQIPVDGSRQFPELQFESYPAIDLKQFAQQDGAEQKRQLNPTAPIRITVDTRFLTTVNDPNSCRTLGQIVFDNQNNSVTCEQDDLFTAEKRDFLINTLLATAESRLEAALRVVPLSNLVMMETMCVSDLTTPTEYTTTGVSGVDFVIFVTSRPIANAGTLAFASACELGTMSGVPAYRRPIAGHANFDADSIDPNGDTNLVDRQIITAIHEITHALGFSFGFWENSFFDPTTNMTATGVFDDMVAGPAGVTQYFLTTPTVTALARSHFNCPTLMGAEMELSGGLGTARSHFEKRAYYSELMQGSVTSRAYVSMFTLAVLQDSGYYLADMSAADQFVWGLGLGCDFVNAGAPGSAQGCQSGGSFDVPGYACTGSTALGSNQELGCNHDRTSRAICFLQNNNPPSEYQWFSDTSLGGADILADYCPLLVAASDGACNIGSNNPGILDGFRRGESYGDSRSRCFQSTLNEGEIGIDIPATVGYACHVTGCASETDLRVRIGSRYFYRCPAGGSLSAQDFGGSLVCPPDPRVICQGVPDTSSEWPVFTSISPSSGSDGTRVTITGMNFENGTTVEIGDSNCDQLQVVDSTTITCRVTTSGTPEALLGQDAGVAIINSNGNSDVGLNAFTINKSLSDLAQDIEDFIVDYPWAFVLIVLFICCCYGCCFWLCYKEYRAKKKSKPSPTARLARISMEKVGTIGRRNRRTEW